MAFLIGTDEAGYGPNLGPLTICGTLWSTDQPLNSDTNLYHMLSDAVSLDSQSDKLQIADSKEIYHAAGTLKTLETNVLAIILAVAGIIPTSRVQLSEVLKVDEDVQPFPAMDGSPLQIPICAETTAVQSLASSFQAACHEQDVQLLDCECRSLPPSRFNSLVDRLGNKAEVLSSQTLELVSQLRDKTDGDLLISCDKHGGRSKYAGMINQFLTPEFIRIHQEAMELSRYTWQEDGRHIEIHFRAKGESFLPVALSSMIAKYVREIAMLDWNRYWQLKKPGIRPTKGYPVDARRFKKEIASVQFELGIDDETIWRKR